MSANNVFADLPDVPDRFQTMALCSSGPSTLPRERRARQPRDPINVGDIPGAQPRRSRGATVSASRPTFHDPGDVAGSQPAVLHPKLNKKSTVCYNDDIEGSKAKPSHFSTTRTVDPLAPQYSLPRVPVKVATPPKQLRDTMDTTDIAGTSPAKYHKFATRDSHNVRDIDGAHPEWQPHHKALLSGRARDVMKVDDIVGGRFKTKRVTDPLRPEHVINGVRVADDDPKMRPKPLPRGRSGPFLALSTEDIEGANGSFKPKHVIPGGLTEDMRRDFRVTNRVDDIEGASADTLKRAMRTKRVTDPNAREYQLPGGDVHHVPEALAHRPMDPRDEELTRLRAEVEALRKDAEIMRLEKEIATLKSSPRGGAGGGAGGGTAASSRPPRPDSSAQRLALRSSGGGGAAGAAAATPSARRGMASSRSTPSLAGSRRATPVSARRDRDTLRSSASRTSLRSSGSDLARIAGTPDMLRLATPASSRSRSHTARSSAPRTPVSHRSAADRTTDIAAVSSLPDSLPASRAGGSSSWRS